MSVSDNSRISASFRDPSGFLFTHQGQLFRQVNQVYREDYDLLISSGLYDRLVKQKLLIPHVEVETTPALPEIAYKVIAPERIGFISYPYEWSFSEYKDAALVTLSVHREAFQAGMILKDASAYNIQFHHGRPVMIDTLSFARYTEGTPWVAYRQFCQHFLAPLALMSHTDIRLSQMLRTYIDGIPLDLASQLLPGRTRFNLGLATHIRAHAFAQAHASDAKPAKPAATARFSKYAFIGLIDSLEGAIKKLVWKPAGTDWVDYYDATNYSDSAFDEKKQIVSDLIHAVAPEVIWDLGANTGVFSRLAEDLPATQVISTDIDPGAVEVNYLECKRHSVQNVLPLVLDLTNPSASIGWANAERQSFSQRGPADLLLALALIHHLAISNNVPLDGVARYLASIGRHLIIEFVPKEDSQVKRLLASRDDIFHNYTLEGFVQAFSAYFETLKRIPIAGTSRTLFLFKTR